MSTQRETPRLRASDAEREKVAAIVQAATGTGRLTTAEAEERLTAVYATVFTDELGPLVADLPVERGTEPKAEPLPWRSMVRGPLGVHAAVVVALSTIMVVRWFFLGIPFFWPAFPIAWLGVSLLVHYGIRRSRQLRGRDYWQRSHQEAPFTQPQP